jgi:hypothetical protein
MRLERQPGPAYMAGTATEGPTYIAGTAAEGPAYIAGTATEGPAYIGESGTEGNGLHVRCDRGYGSGADGGGPRGEG